jgi:hypothetical protein
MRGTNGINSPMIVFAVRDQCANAGNGMVYVLWEFIAHDLTNFSFSFAGQIIRSGEAVEVRNCLDVPNYDVAIHFGASSSAGARAYKIS